MSTKNNLHTGQLYITELQGTPVTGRVVHISERRLGIALVEPYGYLFNEFRPAYFSKFLLGDGFFGPEGEHFVREQIQKLHRAAVYLQHVLPQVSEALKLEETRHFHFVSEFHPRVDLCTPLTGTSFRDSVLRMEQRKQAKGTGATSLLHWQEPFVQGLLQLQANVLLYHWLRNGPIDLCTVPTGPLGPDTAGPLPYYLN